jgi:hypothetical protein
MNPSDPWFSQEEVIVRYGEALQLLDEHSRILRGDLCKRLDRAFKDHDDAEFEACIEELQRLKH